MKFLLPAVLLLAACNQPQSSAAVPADRVQWQDYAAELKGRIDHLAAAKDCTGLQQQFDIADKNDDATRNRTGHGNSELMGYIDSAMHGAGCY